jgi:hypothetical protein
MSLIVDQRGLDHEVLNRGGSQVSNEKSGCPIETKTLFRLRIRRLFGAPLCIGSGSRASASSVRPYAGTGYASPIGGCVFETAKRRALPLSNRRKRRPPLALDAVRPSPRNYSPRRSPEVSWFR